MKIQDLQELPPWEWPQKTGELLLKVLADAQSPAEDREMAAQMASSITVMNDDLADVLLKIITNSAEPPMMRALAAISLGPALETCDLDGFEEVFGDEELDHTPITEPMFDRVRETLRAVYDDHSVPKEVRRRVLEADVRAPQPWHEDAIRTAYASGDPEWKLTAVFAMRWVKGFDREILEAIKNPDEEIQAEAVEAAGNWELQPAWPHVTALVKDRKTPRHVLLAAIGAVGQIRPKDAYRALQHLEDSRDEEIAAAVEDALSMLDSGENEDNFD